jgi:hypothetical protein
MLSRILNKLLQRLLRNLCKKLRLRYGEEGKRKKLAKANKKYMLINNCLVTIGVEIENNDIKIKQI